MSLRSSRFLFAIAAAALLLGSARESLAVPITLPTGLNPGDQYRLIFVTTTTTASNLAGGIAAYNAIVQTEAAADPIINALGATWSVVGSSSSVSAKSNTGTDPFVSVGVPIYNLGGLLVAATNGELWGAYDFLNTTLSNPVQYDRTGAEISTAVWTGADANGNIPGSGQNALSGTNTNHLIGRSDLITQGWEGNQLVARTQIHPLYAMSSIITVVPEPGTALLLAMGLGGLRFLGRVRRS